MLYLQRLQEGPLLLTSFTKLVDLERASRRGLTSERRRRDTQSSRLFSQDRASKRFFFVPKQIFVPRLTSIQITRLVVRSVIIVVVVVSLQ